MYIYYKLTSVVHAVVVEFYLGERSKDVSQHPFAGVEAALHLGIDYSITVDKIFYY